jgi:hypothetical protein
MRLVHVKFYFRLYPCALRKLKVLCQSILPDTYLRGEPPSVMQLEKLDHDAEMLQINKFKAGPCVGLKTWCLEAEQLLHAFEYWRESRPCIWSWLRMLSLVLLYNQM